MRQLLQKWSVLLIVALILEIMEGVRLKPHPKKSRLSASRGRVSGSNLRWVAARDGNVPAFAVVGGENFSGEMLYVARVRLDSGWTPGKMAPSYKKAHTSYGGTELFNSEYEILTNPDWKSHLEWKESNGHDKPSNAVVGGSDKGKTVYVARFMYGDGHMICGKAMYDSHKAYVGYNWKELESSSFYVLVEHPRWYMRSLSKQFFPELSGAKKLKRVSVLKEEDEKLSVNL